MGGKPSFRGPTILLHPTEVGAWIGARLAEHRLAANLTRVELALRAGVAPETIKLVETRGRSSLETLTRLLAALGLQDRLETFFALRAPTSLDELVEREAMPTRKRARRKTSR